MSTMTTEAADDTGFEMIGGGQSPVKDDSNDAVRARAARLKKQIDTAYIVLGRDLYMIFHRRLYIEWGHDSFDDYLEQELGCSRSRGERVRRIWAKFIKELGLKSDALEGIGYSNALALLGIVTADNHAEWIEKAKTLSWRDLVVQIAIAKSPPDEVIESLTGAGVPIKKPEEDDDDLSGEGGFDDLPAGGGGGSLPSERSGLTSSGSSPDRRRPPKDTFDPDGKPKSAIEVMATKKMPMKFALYDHQYKVVQAALDEVRRAKATEVPPNEAIAHVATEFLANRMTKEEKPASRVSFYLSTFERVFGGKFVWIKDDAAAAVLVKAMEEHPELFSDSPASSPTTRVDEERSDEHPDEGDDSDDGDDGTGDGSGGGSR